MSSYPEEQSGANSESGNRNIPVPVFHDDSLPDEIDSFEEPVQELYSGSDESAGVEYEVFEEAALSAKMLSLGSYAAVDEQLLGDVELPREDVTGKAQVWSSEENMPEEEFAEGLSESTLGDSSDELSHLAPEEQSEDVEVDNPFLMYDENEDSGESIEARRKRLMREVRWDSENSPVPSGSSAVASRLTDEKIRKKARRKKYSRSLVISLTVTVILLLGSVLAAAFTFYEQRAASEQQEYVIAEYDLDASSLTMEVPCSGWSVREDKSSFTKNIECEDGSAVALYSRGVIDPDTVWPRAASLLRENDAYVVTDNYHWGVIAEDEGMLTRLSEKFDQPVCTLRRNQGLVCPGS